MHRWNEDEIAHHTHLFTLALSSFITCSDLIPIIHSYTPSYPLCISDLHDMFDDLHRGTCMLLNNDLWKDIDVLHRFYHMNVNIQKLMNVSISRRTCMLM